MKQVGNYNVDEKAIGSGGMGQVFRGTSPDGRAVAIKEILPQFVSDPEYRSRIEREIEFMKMIDNPNVVKIYDSFEENNCLYIVMELIDGLNIEEYIGQNGPMEWRRALGYMIQLLNTLQDVHNHEIVHRDIKPGNIMIRSNGEICLLDFGVAKDISVPANEGATMLGTVIGTDGYMSPEQAQGMSIDHRADIYSLGCVLYFMLTGAHAFNAISDHEMKNNIIHKQFPRLAEKRSDLPPALQVVLDRAVDKNMVTRHQTCTAFAEQLNSVLTGKTMLRTGQDSQQFEISIGRENCDIIVDNLRVSRHHADVRLKQFTGGEFFIYTDHSSNGTQINGTQLSKGMSYNIRRGDMVHIVLAGEGGIQLSMIEIENALKRKYPDTFGAKPTPAPAPPGVFGGYAPMQGAPLPIGIPTKSLGFSGAISKCFKKYATFTGRASRAEYWWFVLFNFIVEMIIGLAFLFIFLGMQDTFRYAPEEAVALILIFSVIYGLYYLAVLLPSLAVMIRRFHDVGRGWKLFFCTLIPVVNIYFCIYALILLCTAGDRGMNKYGPPPSDEDNNPQPAPGMW